MAGPARSPRCWPTRYTDGFLVLHDGQVVTEQYPTGMPADRTHLLMSVSKSFIGCVIGILADRGVIDVSAAVDYYVPELALPAIAARRSRTCSTCVRASRFPRST